MFDHDAEGYESTDFEDLLEIGNVCQVKYKSFEGKLFFIKSSNFFRNHQTQFSIFKNVGKHNVKFKNYNNFQVLFCKLKLLCCQN